MQRSIPVSFEFRGQTIKGYLKAVMGAGGGSVFHLGVPDRYNPQALWYWGRLRYNGHPDVNAWQFDPTPKTNELSVLAEYFGWVIIAWVDCHG